MPKRAAAASPPGVIGDLLAFFTAFAAKRPLVLVIDDWQWADDASRQLLEALLRNTPAARALSSPAGRAKTARTGFPAHRT